MSAITDEEIEELIEADRILRTGEGDIRHGLVVQRSQPKLIARIRADAAKIADLRRQVEERDTALSQIQVAIYDVHDVHEVFNGLLDVDGNPTTFGNPARRLQALLYQHQSALEAKDATIARLEAEMKRLRTVAIAAGRWAAAYAHTEEESSALDELLAALAPGDLGGEG